jgi:hypothetical protein
MCTNSYTNIYIRNCIKKGKPGQSPSLIAEHFPGKVTDFTAFSLPPRIAFTFHLLPKSDDVSLCWFHIPPRVRITFYLPPPPPDHFLCTSPMYQVALAPFHQKRCYRPYLCFYHTTPLVFRTLVYPHLRLKPLLLYLSLVKVNFCSTTVCSRVLLVYLVAAVAAALLQNGGRGGSAGAAAAVVAAVAAVWRQRGGKRSGSTGAAAALL